MERPAGAQCAAPLPPGVPHPPSGQARLGAGRGQGGSGQDVRRPPARERNHRRLLRGHEGRQGAREHRLQG
eukprot:12351509-Alexandrium_andersonii.AAC.1